MSENAPTLHMLCGKIGSGKSTLAAQLAEAENAVIITEDTWLHALFDDQLTSLPDYVRCTGKLRNAMAPHIATLLGSGVSVVLDFAANTAKQRAWLQTLLTETGAAHQLHVLDVPDAICLERLHARNASGTHPFDVSDEQFHQFSQHFAPPTEAEGFNVVVHRVEA